MFTGIIGKIGEISKIEKIGNKIYFTIKVCPVASPQMRSAKQLHGARGFLRGVKIGNSISCDGVCLTVVKKIKDSFKVELMPETLRLTKFKNSKVNDLINLELALKLGEKLDGHFVMGHVDGTGRVARIIKEGDFKNVVIKVPKKLVKYLAYKGSITVNGVSLTISGSGKDWLKVSLITHTLENTNLKELKKCDLVNIEVDMVARYLGRLLKI